MMRLLLVAFLAGIACAAVIADENQESYPNELVSGPNPTPPENLEIPNIGDESFADITGEERVKSRRNRHRRATLDDGTEETAPAISGEDSNLNDTTSGTVVNGTAGATPIDNESSNNQNNAPASTPDQQPADNDNGSDDNGSSPNDDTNDVDTDDSSFPSDVVPIPKGSHGKPFFSGGRPHRRPHGHHRRRNHHNRHNRRHQRKQKGFHQGNGLADLDDQLASFAGHVGGRMQGKLNQFRVPLKAVAIDNDDDDDDEDDDNDDDD